MEIFHYEGVAEVIWGDEIFTVGNLHNKTKTKGISHNGMTARIKTEEIRISPITYWSVSSQYDHHFEGYDANCYLCGWYGVDYGTCKCKKSFTIEEHMINQPIARKNFLITVLRNCFKDNVAWGKKLTDEQVKEVLYYDDPVNGYKLMMEVPSWSNRTSSIERMTKHLKKVEPI